MTGLKHVEIQPAVFVKPFCRSSICDLVWLRMKCHQCFVASPASFFDPFCHRSPDSHIVVVAWIAVATDDPDDVLLVFITVSYPPAIYFCISRIEDLRTYSKTVFVNLVAPCWKQTDVYPELLRLSDDKVYVLEIRFTGFGRIIVFKRSVAVWIGIVKSVEIGKHCSLNNIESLV